MAAEMVDHVVGIDPDRDWIAATVLDTDTAGVVATGRFAADAADYRDAVACADDYSVDTERAWAIERSASYGQGLTAALIRSRRLAPGTSHQHRGRRVWHARVASQRTAVRAAMKANSVSVGWAENTGAMSSSEAPKWIATATGASTSAACDPTATPPVIR